jgi:superfamily II DNA helicase RecQ
MNRPNVALHIVPYNVSISQDVDIKEWFNVSKQIHQMIDGENTIVCCDYAADYEPCLVSLWIEVFFFNRKKTPTMENRIYSNMKNGSIDVLVATKAFGVGVNIPDIRHVIHMGIPQNLSCLVQESGRAGRNGHQVHSYVMLCEYQDMKQFQFWTTSGSQQEIETLHEDYVQI